VGSEATVTDATTAAAAPAVLLGTEATRRPPQVEHAELLAELTERFTAADGTTYLVRIWGARSQGTWAGWLEFAAADASDVRLTGQETTQPDRERSCTGPLAWGQPASWVRSPALASRTPAAHDGMEIVSGNLQGVSRLKYSSLKQSDVRLNRRS